MKNCSLAALLLLALVLSACDSESGKAVNDVTKSLDDQISNVKDKNEPHVLSVKNGHMQNYPQKTVDEAFMDFFGDPTWKYFKADSGEDVVEFTGFMMYQKTKVKARLQFIVHSDNTFDTGALSFNDVPQNRLVTAAVFNAVFKSQNDDAQPASAESESAIPNAAAEPSASSKQTDQADQDVFSLMSYEEKTSLNVFFSNFSEVNFQDYDAEAADAGQLIDFAILHNYINNNSRIGIDGDLYSLKDTFVADTVKKYFGFDIKHQPTGIYQYDGIVYSWPAASGEPFSDFSQVQTFHHNGDGTFTAMLAIYNAGTEYEGQKIIYEPMDEAWGNDVTPEYRGKATAVVKPAKVNGKNTYQLLHYTLIA